MVSSEILLLFLLVIIASSAEGQVSTKPPLVTAYLGKSAELPCQISKQPYAVFWYQHNFAGAPDNEARIVVQSFNGEGIAGIGPRFEITSNFSLMIHNVTVQDETTYSCRVGWFDDEVTSYTHLRVVALADEFNPIVVENCRKTGTDRCVYYIDPSESTIQLKCVVIGVRPAVNLIWMNALIGEVVPSGKTNRTVDRETELITVYRVTSVSGSDIGQDRMCQANGEAVGGTSNLTVYLLKEPQAELVQHQNYTAIAVATLLSVFVLAIVAAAVIGWFIGRGLQLLEKKSKDEGEDSIPLSPNTTAEIEEKREIIRDYTPGMFSVLNIPDDVVLPRRVKLSVIGPTGSGKSLFIRSLNYVISGTFTMSLEDADKMTSGGVTLTTESYKITESIIVEEIRGLNYLDAECIPDLFKTLRDRGVHCPIFMYNHTIMFKTFSCLRPIAPLNKFLSKLTTWNRKVFGSHPVIVFTNLDKTQSGMDSIKDEARAVGAFDDKLFFIENFTDELEHDDEDLEERMLEFLTVFHKLLDFADDNLVQYACEPDDPNVYDVVTDGKGSEEGIQTESLV